MDYQVLIHGPLKAFGIKHQEVEQGILKIRIGVKSNSQSYSIVSFNNVNSNWIQWGQISKDTDKMKIGILTPYSLWNLKCINLHYICINDSLFPFDPNYII